MFSLTEPPLFARLSSASNVLLAGAGGGFDVYLANLAFSELSRLDLDDWVAPDIAAIHPESAGNDDYFPERTPSPAGCANADFPRPCTLFPVSVLDRWRRRIGRSGDTWRWTRSCWWMAARTSSCAVTKPGSVPRKDMSSLAAVSAIEGVDRLVVCLGFGIDVCHTHVLENLAALDRAVDFTSRTAGSELFVNPLMGVYFTVDLPALAASVGYLDRLRGTETMIEVAQAIEDYREGMALRPREVFPH